MPCIFRTNGITLAIYCNVVYRIVASPAEHTEEETLDRLHLNGSYKVLVLIGVGRVDTLSVGNHCLIVDKSVSVLTDREEVALKLYALVTPTVR